MITDTPPTSSNFFRDKNLFLFFLISSYFLFKKKEKNGPNFTNVSEMLGSGGLIKYGYIDSGVNKKVLHIEKTRRGRPRIREIHHC